MVCEQCERLETEYKALQAETTELLCSGAALVSTSHETCWAPAIEEARAKLRQALKALLDHANRCKHPTLRAGVLAPPW